jgi:magnesium-transporting ATPase (P-type)
MTPHPQQALQGLTSAEARKRCEIYGRNLAVEHRPGQRLLEFGKLLLDPMAIMLAVAAGLIF